MNITNRQMQKFLLLCVSIYNAEVLGLTVQGGGWSALWAHDSCALFGR